MAVPSLRIPLGLNMAEFDKNIESAKSGTATATRFIAKQFLDMNASMLATGGAAGASALALRSVLGVIGPLGAAVTAIVGVFKLMAYATELAKEKIEEFNAIAEKAAKANVSTDFFQRYAKSAEILRMDVDDATAALERFNRVSTNRLGGSELQGRVGDLQKAGNFNDNSGIGALSGATDTESKMRATVLLIREAIEAGERLAALDLAEKAFGSKVAANLRQDAGYLDQMLATADKLAATKIISDEQVGLAIALKTRLEESEKILADKFKPIQDDLAKLGMRYHESWIEINETMAGAVEKANSLYASMKRLPEVLADFGNASFWGKLTEVSEKLGLNSRPDGLVKRGEEGFGRPAGHDALTAAMNNPNAIRRAMQEATEIEAKVRGDKSKAPADAPKAASDVKDQYDRAIEGLEKHTARLQADTAAVGLGTAALEEFRAKNALLTAAQQAGIPVTAEVAKRIDEVAKAAGAAGDALAKARVAGDIKFGSGTAFLSQEDVRIAQQLRGIYGNDIPAALASSQAAALRLNDATREISSTISSGLVGSIADVMDGTKTAGDAFKDFSRIAIRAINEAIIKLMIVGPLMRGLQGVFGGGAELPNFGTPSFIGPLPGNAEGTDNWRGGLTWVGEKGPEVVNLPRGAQVIPNDILRKGGGSSPVNVTFAPQVDARGADVAAVARLEQGLARQSAELESKVRQIVSGRQSAGW